MSEIFLDTETTGLSFQDGHRIVEIACIETKDLISTGKVFHQLINPERDVTKDALAVHGHSNEFLKNKKKFSDISEEFLNFIEGKKIIIHNAKFDLGFLNNELKICNKKKIGESNVIDSLEIARAKFPGASNSLDALCKRYNIDLSRRKKHNALLDCELLREVYINILEQKEPKLFVPNVDKEEISLRKNKITRKNYCKNVVKIDEKQLNLHNNFIKKELKKNYF